MRINRSGGQGAKGGKLDLRRTHVARMPKAMPTDEETNPIQVYLFSIEAIVKIARPFTHLVQQAFELQGRSAGFHG